MGYFEDVMHQVDRGRAGLNVGLPMGFPVIEEHTTGIQRSRNYIIAGESGSGKSAFADCAFVFNPIDHVLNDPDKKFKIKVFYYSFEITKERLLTKQLCRKLFLDFKLNLDPSYILSAGKNRISAEHYNKLMFYKKYYEQLDDIIEIKDNSRSNNPTGIFKDLLVHSEENGKWDRPDQQGEYKEKDESLYTLTIVDHLGLTPKERNYQTKENIDKLSEYAIILRNKCKFSFVFLSQLNRGINNFARLNDEKKDPMPQLYDLKESGKPGEDCDTAFGIFSPYRHQIDTYAGYDIDRLKQKVRFVNIMKNRDGEADKRKALLFVGGPGYFHELPKAKSMTEDHYYKIERLKSSKPVLVEEEE